eukprot:2752608-Rhodomonas_salina.2
MSTSRGIGVGRFHTVSSTVPLLQFSDSNLPLWRKTSKTRLRMLRLTLKGSSHTQMYKRTREEGPFCFTTPSHSSTAPGRSHEQSAHTPINLRSKLVLCWVLRIQRWDGAVAVSYTHLTLPTICSV